MFSLTHERRRARSLWTRRPAVTPPHTWDCTPPSCFAFGALEPRPLVTMAVALLPGLLRATKMQRSTAKIFRVVGFIRIFIRIPGLEALGWRGQGDERGRRTRVPACGTRGESTQGSTSAMARYGGWTMKKLTVAYCEYSGSSRGAR